MCYDYCTSMFCFCPGPCTITQHFRANIGWMFAFPSPPLLIFLWNNKTSFFNQKITSYIINMFSLRKKKAKNISQALLKRSSNKKNRFCSTLQLASSQCKPFCCHSKFHSTYNMVLIARKHHAVHIFLKTREKPGSQHLPGKETYFICLLRLQILSTCVNN